MPAPKAGAKTPAKPASKASPVSGKKPVASVAASVAVGRVAGKVVTQPAGKPNLSQPASPPPAAGDPKKQAPKGITVVPPKPSKKPVKKVLEMPFAPLLKSGMKWKPLIASGPKAPPSTGIPGVTEVAEYQLDPKAKLPKKELDRYREILLAKRAELIGDIRNMEEEALRASSGSLSSMPQHMAEQGSDTFDQAISLDLAQVDRDILREIDAALNRIDEGTYGICERTGKRIAAERLAELPWARYSIEAARQMERRSAAAGEVASEDDDL
jgi:DnaK suppressor protein